MSSLAMVGPLAALLAAAGADDAAAGADDAAADVAAGADDAAADVAAAGAELLAGLDVDFFELLQALRLSATATPAEPRIRILRFISGYLLVGVSDGRANRGM
jgi:hypothetical protein